MEKNKTNELKTRLKGEWDNPEFTIGFVDSATIQSNENSNGIVCIYKKQTRQDFGFNYRVKMENGFPYLYLITKGKGLKYFQRLFINDFETVTQNELCLVFDFGSELRFNKINS